MPWKRAAWRTVVKRPTVDAVCRAGREGLETERVLFATGGAATTVTRRLAALEELALVDSRGAGVKGIRQLVWLATGPTSAQAPAPTSDPDCTRYLNSTTWADRRAAILDRAAGRCEGRGGNLRSTDAEVRHLTHARAGRERAADSIANPRSDLGVPPSRACATAARG
jgi:hypothetical protein